MLVRKNNIKNHVVCVKWGTLYDARFVNNLYTMCKHNLNIPFHFHCITNNRSGIAPEVNILPNEDHELRGWWQKIIYFKDPFYDIKGTVLALDLDLILTKNIDHLFTYEPNKFVMTRNWLGEEHTSCVMRFPANEYSYIYDNLDISSTEHSIDNKNRRTFKNKKYWGDHLWIYEQTKNDPFDRKVELWPEKWIQLFGIRTHKNRRFYIPEGCKVIVWAGYKNDQRRGSAQVQKYWNPQAHRELLKTRRERTRKRRQATKNMWNK